MVQKKSECYTTTDGKEFLDEVKATSHQEMLDAASRLVDAQKSFCVAKSINTVMADGVQFSFGRWDYFALLVPHGSVPRISRIYIDRWHICLDENGDACAYDVADGHGSSSAPRRWKIAELYGTQEGAREACAAAMKTWLVERQTEFAKTLKEWGMP